MALLDPKTYQGGLTSVPGKSLSETNTPEQIQAAQQPQQQQPVSNPPSTLPNQPPSGMFGVNAPAGSQYQFANVLQTAIDRQKALDPLIKQRQLLIKHLYDTPLSSAEISQLSPEIQQAIQTGNKPDIEMQLRLLSDGISNRSGTLDQSIQFLTQQYQQSQQDLEQQRQQAVDNVLKFAGTYGSRAKDVLSSLYGPQYLDQLKSYGIDIDKLTAQPTISEQRYVSPTISANYGISNWNPADPTYADKISTLSQKIGSITSASDAQSYITKTMPNSPITGDMVMNAALQYDVDPSTLIALFQQESSLNTAGAAVKNNNPGNLKFANQQGATQGTKATDGGYFAKFATLQDGINANARQLSMMESSTPQVSPIVQAYANDVLNGTISSIAQVPKQYKDQVAMILNSDSSGGKQSYSPLAANRFTRAANAIVANYINLPQYQLTANGLPYLQRIDAAMKTPGSISDQDLLDSLTKLNTAGNAISDAQVKLITDGQTFKDWANVLQNKFTTGGVLSDTQRNQIQSIAQAIYANYKKGYQPVYDQATAQLQDAGIPKAFWTIPDLNDLSEKALGSGTHNEISQEINSIQQYYTSGKGYNTFNIPGYQNIKTREDLIKSLQQAYPEMKDQIPNLIYTQFTDVK